MVTLAHAISRCMPQPLGNWLRPKWYWTREYCLLRFSEGGYTRYDSELLCRVVRKPVGKTYFEAPYRSYREFRRIVNFGRNPDDLVFIWLNAISDCETLYDIGAANGHEGLVANALHQCRIVYVELFTPSIDSILKGTVLAQRRGAAADQFEVVAAGCDRKEGYAKVLLHQPPVPGGTYNTFADVDAYCRGGRSDERVWTSQWSPSVTIDALHGQHHLPKPTHIKMDIDGFEDRAIEGACETLKSRCVKSWIIEVNPGREEMIANAMTKNGYKDIAQFVHYPGLDDAVDHLYVRDDLVADYERRLAETSQRLFGKNTYDKKPTLRCAAQD